MKQIKYLIRICVILAIVQFYACEKLIDHLPGKPKNCRVKRIYFDLQVSTDHYGVFYYNKWGNPDSVIYGHTGTALTNQFFRYNHKQQLIQARFTYEGGGVERLHRYGYTKGVITTDTSYSWPSQEEPEPLHYVNKSIIYFEYDNYGRIIKEKRNLIYPANVTDSFIYQYNSHGNRIYGSNVSFDNYNNIYTTHPIWQFLSRDYSLNNPAQAASYNNFRLPTKFDSPHDFFSSHFFLDRMLNKSVIEYECK